VSPAACSLGPFATPVHWRRFVPLGSKSSRKKSHWFEVPIQDMVLRVTGPEELYEEARAAGLQFWEQLQSYGIRDREFRTSKRPVTVPDNAPAIVKEMADAARQAGVGPVFTFQGAITDHVGRFIAQRTAEVLVSNGGDYFVVTRKRSRLGVPIGGHEGQSLAIVVRPEVGAHGIYTTAGRTQSPGDAADGLVVVASSCMLADAAAAAAGIVLRRSESMEATLDYLQRLPGVFGALIVQGRDVGVAGSLELAA
jgi:ApbE superfamily uncharacterized protein (UPF0280 family)